MLDFIMGIIGTLLYPLFGIFFGVIDIMEMIFNAFAGVGTIYIAEGWGTKPIGAGNDGSQTDTGIVYYFLQHNIIKNLLVSIMMLGLFLLIIFTAMAFIKNAYSAKQKTWQEIVGSAFKGLANFIFIPVCCLLGVWLGNILLNAIDGATSYGGGSTMSRKLFLSVAYNANIYRNSNGKVGNAVDKITKVLEVYDLSEVLDPPEEGQSKEYYATYVDKMYGIGNGIGGYGGQISLISHYDVGQFYNLYQINYLMLIIVGVFMISALLSLAYGMVRRMLLILMMFVVSPALCAMYPLDEGNATNAYKKKFVEQVLSAYAAVAGMNIFMSLLPLIEKISLTRTSAVGTTGDLDLIVQILILVSGLYVVKEFIGIIAGWIGAEDALKAGEGMKKQTTGAIGKAAKGAAGAFGKAMGAKKAGGSFMGSLAKQAGGGMMGSAFGINPNDIKKTYKDSKKDSYKDAFDKRKESTDAKKLKNDMSTKKGKGSVEGVETAQAFEHAAYKPVWTTDRHGNTKLKTEKKQIIDDKAMEEILDSAGSNDALRKEYARKIAEWNMQFTSDDKGNPYFGGDQDKVMEKYNKMKDDKAKEKRAKNLTGAFEERQEDADKAHMKVVNLRTNLKDLLNFDGEGKASAKDTNIEGKIEAKKLEIQEIISKGGDAKIERAELESLYQKKADTDSAMNEYNAALQKSTTANEKLEATMESLKSVIELRAESAKGGEKVELDRIASLMQQQLESTARPIDMANDIKKAMESSTSKAIQEILKQIKQQNKNNQ